MSIYNVFLIGLALSLDAFGVALSIGFNNEIKKINKIYFIISFAFFQFLFAYLGGLGGFLFNTYIVSVPKVIGGIIIAIVGLLMIKEGRQEKNKNILLSTKMYFILGISVSIDALVVGFTTLNVIKGSLLFLNGIFIGLITLVMCSVAFFISRYLKKISIVSRYADYIGGIILIIFGIKMIFF
ncbi:manganese efflux pump MntP family protein [Clostridium oceanicum]|uniref:Putative manganese efflux pump MntP n=1 Tax=Clostridium oceanicum TaxID=1543 RepID=A0ABP3V086_9CLOT